MAGELRTTRAIVAHEPTQGRPEFTLEPVTISRDIKPDELLVRMVATGVCHTDIVFAMIPVEAGGPFPKVLGHEGAGFVVQAGSASVSSFAPGSAVLLSFSSCLACHHCTSGHPSYCTSFAEVNYTGEQKVYSNSSGNFFGQSSFSNFAIVKASSAVNVSELVEAGKSGEEELKLFAPMGCGFQTGVGTVDVLCGAGANDSIVIMGLGGVGLAAVMGAKIKQCHNIIGIDRYPSRLELAKTLGATHTINTADTDLDLPAAIKKLTDGVGSSITIDTTGNVGLIEHGMDFTGNRGQMTLLGVPPWDGQLGIKLIEFMQTGKSLRGSIEGDVTPSKYIPKMIQWYRDGKLPIDRITKFYPVDDLALALSDIHSGATVKAVLIW